MHIQHVFLACTCDEYMQSGYMAYKKYQASIIFADMYIVPVLSYSLLMYIFLLYNSNSVYVIIQNVHNPCMEPCIDVKECKSTRLYIF